MQKVYCDRCKATIFKGSEKIKVVVDTFTNTDTNKYDYKYKEIDLCPDCAYKLEVINKIFIGEKI